MDAVRCLVDNGIKWRAMPADFPVWDRGYAFARRWRPSERLGELHERLRGLVREDAGRDPEPTAAVIDSQSLRAAATVPASSRGYDGAKKVPGRKRHIVVACLGLLLAVMVTAADVTDRDAAMPLLERVREYASGRPVSQRRRPMRWSGPWTSPSRGPRRSCQQVRRASTRSLSPFLVEAPSGLGEEALASEAPEATAGDVHGWVVGGHAEEFVQVTDPEWLIGMLVEGV